MELFICGSAQERQAFGTSAKLCMNITLEFNIMLIFKGQFSQIYSLKKKKNNDIKGSVTCWWMSQIIIAFISAFEKII